MSAQLSANTPRKILVVPRCGICSFELLEGDRVVVVDRGGRHESDYPFVPWGCSRHKERLPGVQYNGPLSEDWAICGGDVGCHAECFACEPCTPPRARFEAMAYHYYPSRPELERRERWLRLSYLAPALHKILRRRFAIPLEVCQLIAEYCQCPVAPVREWAAAAARSFWEQYSASRVPEYRAFNISSDVWACRLEFEGVQYITSLTNEPGNHPASESTSLIYSPLSGKEVDRLYIAEDYFGIRDVFFVSSLAMPALPLRPGAWWKRLEIPPGTYFQTGTDCTKLRVIYLHGPNLSIRDSSRAPAFEHPPHPTQQFWWHDIFPSLQCMRRMTSLVCNGPSTTAYSVCCDNRPYTIRAHTTGERDLTFYAAETRPERYAAVWLYMPLWKDERIAKIWVRYLETGYFNVHHAAFIVRTNQNRTFVLGSHLPDGKLGDVEYSLVYVAGENPDRIYFDIWLQGIHQLALKGPTYSLEQLQLPRPESACPSRHEKEENYFYTSAVLDDVAEMTPCRSDLGIIGLLLYYQDGRQASLGQVRLDRLDKARIKVDPSRQMWLHFSVSPAGCPNVDAITFEPPTQAGPDHFAVHWHGTLEWWFSHRQCQLWHDHRSSPPTVPGNAFWCESL